MKRILSLALGLILCTLILSAQDPEAIVTKCALGVGDNTIPLKEFVIKLPEVAPDSDDKPVHKENIYLMKNQSYRFTMCNSDNSNGELFVSLYDKQKQITSSYVTKSETVYSSVEFECNKTGLYQLWYSFKDGLGGNGAGIVSLVR